MRLRQSLHEMHQDAAIALRQLRRSPGFAVVSTLTLALGIGATTAVFAVVDSVMLRPSSSSSASARAVARPSRRPIRTIASFATPREPLQGSRPFRQP